MKIHILNTKKCANLVIHLSHIPIWCLSEAKIWIVQNYSSDKGLTQLCGVFIVKIIELL